MWSIDLAAEAVCQQQAAFEHLAQLAAALPHIFFSFSHASLPSQRTVIKCITNRWWQHKLTSTHTHRDTHSYKLICIHTDFAHTTDIPQLFSLCFDIFYSSVLVRCVFFPDFLWRMPCFILLPSEKTTEQPFSSFCGSSCQALKINIGRLVHLHWWLAMKRN